MTDCTPFTPDTAPCPDCVTDTLDPFSRWYRYPFTSCPACGPRFSIRHLLRGDRHNTSMATVPLCPECARVWEDSGDRRFHAPAITCHKCGPRAWLERADGKAIVADMFSMMDDVDAACTLLQRGEIVAIKGMGGIHLACDGTQEVAVQKLRQRKRCHDIPFALMARDLTIIEQYCDISSDERKLLQSPAAPIVVLRRRSVPNLRSGNSCERAIAPGVAPGVSTIGFMLPCTPLHHLMLRRMNRPIVVTSGNLAGEPPCSDNGEAREQLGAIADFLLLHDQDIVNRSEDSVVQWVDGQLQTLRRSRGYAPAPIPLPAGFAQAPAILAMGSDRTNTFCLLENGRATLSQHLGNLENATTFAAYQKTLQGYLDLCEQPLQAIAVDSYSDYLSVQLGRELAQEKSLLLQSVQHHHAHIAACLAENGIPLENAPVLGIVLDDLGWNADGMFWRGEFWLADYYRSQHLAHFQPVDLPPSPLEISLATAIAQSVQQLSQQHRFTQIALTGGSFLNRVLAGSIYQQLTAMSFAVLIHHLVPSNNGGLSLGQAVVMAAHCISAMPR